MVLLICMKILQFCFFIYKFKNEVDVFVIFCFDYIVQFNNVVMIFKFLEKYNFFECFLEISNEEKIMKLIYGK